jgi:hypothetical protein
MATMKAFEGSKFDKEARGAPEGSKKDRMMDRKQMAAMKAAKPAKGKKGKK